VISTLFEKLKKKKVMFWNLQCMGWGSYLLIICAIHASAKVFMPRAMLWGALIAFTGFLLSLLMHSIYRNIHFKSLTLIRLFLVALGVTLLTANIWYCLDLLLDLVMKSSNQETMPVTFKNYLLNTFYWELLLFAWSACYFVIKFWMTWQEQMSRTERADLLAKRSQLMMLRYQLNPHFLFNALNSVRALIDENEENAKLMITELSEFLRYSLMNNSHSDIPLKHEIDALRHYFSIEKKRYENKLDVAFDIEPEAAEYRVISFLVHPLAENAIKYGMRTSTLPLKIRIRARVQEQKLKIMICNTGRWVEEKNDKMQRYGTGTGLENVRQRLENAFPDNHRFHIRRTRDQVHILMEIFNN
jgi:two-component system LytT family sensor kinase